MYRLFPALLLFAVPFVASAHGAGAFYETAVGAYMVDVGFSTPTPTGGESVQFDFQLRDVNSAQISGTDVAFTDVWVKVESETGGVVLASGIHNAEFGGPRLSYVFPHTGTYRISVRYENGSESLAEASFPMTVTPSTSTGSDTSVPWVLPFGSGCALGALGVYVLSRRTTVG